MSEQKEAEEKENTGWAKQKTKQSKNQTADGLFYELVISRS